MNNSSKKEKNISIGNEDIQVTNEEGNLNIRIKSPTKSFIEWIEKNKDNPAILSQSKTDFIRNSYRFNPEYILLTSATKNHFEKKFKEVCRKYADGEVGRDEVKRLESILQICEDEYKEVIKNLEKYELHYREAINKILEKENIKNK